MAATIPTNVVTAMATANASAPTATEGQQQPLSMDLNGNLRTSGSATLSGALPAGNNNIGDVDVASIAAGSNIIGRVGIDQTTNGTTNAVALTGYSFTNVSTATTTVVKSGAGVLHAVIVNSLGTIASTLTVYDNTAGSGTVIAIINSLTLYGTFQYDINFATGCTVVSTGTVAPNFTVSYR